MIFLLMAQLISPVCTYTLKFPNSLRTLCSRSRWRMLSRNASLSWNPTGHGEKIEDLGGSGSPLRIRHPRFPDATPEQIKKQYYNCMKSCHPDLSGNDPETTNFCIFINEVYVVLSDPVQRMVYDEIHGYALTGINPFLDDSHPKDHVFVDEFSCIGRKNCANVAPDVFSIEEDFGRARACSQSGTPDLVQQAIESCPVDCIHWASATQLSLLEDEMRRVERVNGLAVILVWGNEYSLYRQVALMLAGMGSSVDVFRMASSRWEKRQIKVLEQARMRMVKQKGSDKAESHWSNLWGNAQKYESTDEEVKKRAKRAAAAARRWREYSRKGADKPCTFKLPEAISNKKN